MKIQILLFASSFGFVLFNLDLGFGCCVLLCLTLNLYKRTKLKMH